MNDLISFELPKSLPNRGMIIDIGSHDSGIIDYIKQQELFGIDFYALNPVNPDLLYQPKQKSLGFGPELLLEIDDNSINDIRELMKSASLNDLMSIIANHRLLFLVGQVDNGIDIKLAQLLCTTAKEMFTLPIGIVTITLSGKEDYKPDRISEKIECLKKSVDSLIIIPIYRDGISSDEESDNQANHLLMLTVKTISDFVNVHGIISVDYADLNQAASNSGFGFFSFGVASGETKIINALKMAISSSTVTLDQISQAKTIILYITVGQDDVVFGEISEMFDIFQKYINEDCDILWNIVYDLKLGNNIRIAIIGTGLEKPSVSGLEY